METIDIRQARRLALVRGGLLRPELTDAIRQLEASGEIVACELVDHGGDTTKGRIRTEDLELAALHYESDSPSARTRHAVTGAIRRYADTVEMTVTI